MTGVIFSLNELPSFLFLRENTISDSSSELIVDIALLAIPGCHFTAKKCSWRVHNCTEYHSEQEGRPLALEIDGGGGGGIMFERSNLHSSDTDLLLA